MNNIELRGKITNIQPSHTIGNIVFNKATLLVPHKDKEDVISLKFREKDNPYKEGDEIAITGNIRSYSYQVGGGKNKVDIYVFTHFDQPENITDNVNNVVISGRICKIEELHKLKNGGCNLHFILANNIDIANKDLRLNSYIPCISWGKLAKEMSSLSVNTNLEITGQIHSREHIKRLENGDAIIRVAHELHVSSYKVIE